MLQSRSARIFAASTVGNLMIRRSSSRAGSARNSPMIVLFTDFGLVGTLYRTSQGGAASARAGGSDHRSVCRLCRPQSPNPRPICWPPTGRGFRLGPCCWRSSILESAAPAPRSSSRPMGALMSVPTMACSRSSCAAPAARNTSEILWRPDRLSASFHGRDLFAPVAARLAAGDACPWAPCAAPAIGRLPDWPDDLPEIVYIDGYGNAMTGLRAAILPEEARLAVGDAGADARPHLFRRAAGHGLLVREFERARRDRGQRRSRRQRAGASTIGTPVSVLP